MCGFDNVVLNITFTGIPWDTLYRQNKDAMAECHGNELESITVFCWMSMENSNCWGNAVFFLPWPSLGSAVSPAVVSHLRWSFYASCPSYMILPQPVYGLSLIDTLQNSNNTTILDQGPLWQCVGTWVCVLHVCVSVVVCMQPCE